MGFFDKFKKRKDNNLQQSVPNVDYTPTNAESNINYSTSTRGGNLQVEYYDENAKFDQFYDTTRLVIKNITTLGGQQVLSCDVSWYSRDDCQIKDEETGKWESRRASDYSQVLAQIDVRRLQIDRDYCTMVMKGLLNQKRVEKYLEKGLQEHTERPCGEYIGGVGERNGKLSKFFSEKVGIEAHYAPYMINRRNKIAIQQINENQRKIDNYNKQIEKLQRENDDLEVR